MVKDPRRSMKTEVLSMRMDPKTRFVVEFLARIRGQSISTVVERAIQEAADRTNIGEDDRTWQHYWHVSEGIRSLMVMSDKQLFPKFDEDYKVAFTKTHWPFFYISNSCHIHKEWAVEVLWPRIDEFVDIWTRTKSTDYFAAGRAMQDAIAAAGLKAPEWPVKPAEKPVAGRSPRSDLDDEIPF